jgi:hypothetical protein
MLSGCCEILCLVYVFSSHTSIISLDTRCDFSITPTQTGTVKNENVKSVVLEETTTSRQNTDTTVTTFGDHVATKGGHPATLSYGTNNETGPDFFQRPPGDTTSEAAVLPASNDSLLVDDDTVPCPPPFHRWTGHSMRFNSYNTSWSGSPFNPTTPFTSSLQSPVTPASTGLDSYLGSFCDTTAGNLAFDNSFESSGEKFLSQEILGTPYAAAPGNYFGSTGSNTLKAAPEATGASGASPVGELSTMLAHVGPIGNVVSSDVNDDAIATSLHLSIPPNVLPTGSRVVQTPDGPAVLLSSLQAAVLHPVAYSSAARQFQHWTEEEDALLKTAVEIEGGSRHNWKKISRKYFLGSRTDTQCKGRWKKVRYVQ